MKKKLITFAATAFLTVSFVGSMVLEQGCTTTQQRQAVNTIAGVETSATAAVDAYYTLVVKGKVSTNGLPKVSRAYDSLQASVRLALTVVQNNTNALAPASLITESTDLINLVNQVKGAK